MSLNKKIIIIILTLATILTSVTIGYSIGTSNGIPAINNGKPTMKPAPAISAIQYSIKPELIEYPSGKTCLEYGTNSYDCWPTNKESKYLVMDKGQQVCLYNLDKFDCYNKTPQDITKLTPDF